MPSTGLIITHQSKLEAINITNGIVEHVWLQSVADGITFDLSVHFRSFRKLAERMEAIALRGRSSQLIRVVQYEDRCLGR